MKRRRLFGVLLALAPAFVAGAAHAQPGVPLIAVLIHGKEEALRHRLEALREGLSELGYVEGRNCRLEVRWSDNQVDRLPGLARELLALKPAVAVAAPVLAAQAFHRESKTVPIVMAGGAGAQRDGISVIVERNE